MKRIEVYEDGVLICSRGGNVDIQPDRKPDVPPDRKPDTPPAPQPIPAGCEIRDFVWGKGFSPNTNGAANHHQTLNGPVAFRTPLTHFNNKQSGSTKYGSIQFYEKSGEIQFCISATPCEFGGPCSGHSDRPYVSADSPDVPSDYLQLPPLPVGQNFYYINIRPTGASATLFLLID